MDSYLATFKSEGFTPDGLVAQNAQLLLHEPIVLSSGQNLKRGALLGKVTASGEYILSASAASDGSQTPVAILAHDCDATAADANTVAYTRGDFIADALILGAGHTVASIKAGLADRGIFLITQQGGV